MPVKIENPKRDGMQLYLIKIDLYSSSRVFMLYSVYGILHFGVGLVGVVRLAWLVKIDS